MNTIYELKFGDVIVNLRSESRLSRQELGDLLGVSKTSIGLYESGRRFPSAVKLVSFCRILKLNTKEMEDMITKERGGRKATTNRKIEELESRIKDLERKCGISSEGH